MPAAITVENLSKRYLVNHSRGNVRPDLRETLINLLKAPFHKLRHGAAHSVRTEEFWALKNLDFEVQEGEVLGVIGRNGAGKSTLLKIFSGIIEPTTGRVIVRGRVGSLLEVGTGFHPDFTGRENVYLNGSILGMTKREIDRQFDAIVDFSGVERFIDTPIKRYSTGMKVRLGFAVAAHLQPEVLIVDEVLAVGDLEFQKKCLGKMENVASSGRTVLFVSHSITAVESLCHRVAVLADGQLVRLGETGAVVQEYVNSFRRIATEVDLSDPMLERQGDGRARIVDLLMQTADGVPVSTIRMSEGIRFCFRIKTEETVRQASIVLALFNSRIQRVTHIASGEMHPASLQLRAHEEIWVQCDIPRLNLQQDRYTINVGIVEMTKNQVVDRVEGARHLDIVASDVFGTSHLPNDVIIFCEGQWTVGNPAITRGECLSTGSRS